MYILHELHFNYCKKNDDDSKKLYYPDKCQICIKAHNLPLKWFHHFPSSLLLYLYAGALRVSVRIRPRSCFCWLKTIT